MFNEKKKSWFYSFVNSLYEYCMRRFIFGYKNFFDFIAFSHRQAQFRVTVSSLSLTNNLLQRGNEKLRFVVFVSKWIRRSKSVDGRVSRSVGRVNALTHARTQTRPPFLLSEKSAIGARENERARQMELGMPRQINGSGLTRWWRGTRLNL